jgi:hypothetical protein
MAQWRAAERFFLLGGKPSLKVSSQIQVLQHGCFAAAVSAEEHGEGAQRDASGLDPPEPADLDALNDW